MSHAPKRRSLAAILGLLVAALPLSVLGGTSPAAAAGEGITVPVRVGSYNIQISRPMTEFTAAITAFKPLVDVAGLQEIGGHIRQNWLDQDQTWGIYRAPSLGQIPIIWNKSVFEFVDGHEHKLADGRDVNAGGGKTIYKKTTYAPVARLRHIPTGQLISIINVHLIQGAINAGRPDRTKPLTWGYYVDQMASLKRAVVAETAAGYQPFVTGDFNIGFEADEQVRHRKHPFRKFKSIDMRSIWQGYEYDDKGTHIDTECPDGRKYCGAYIDGVWSRLIASSATVFNQIELSDHYPLMATFDLPLLPDLPLR